MVKNSNFLTIYTIHSIFEDSDKNFRPVYGVPQLFRKESHTLQIITKFLDSAEVEKYINLPPSRQATYKALMLEELIQHPDTEIYQRTLAQGRERVFLVLNRGKTDYPYPNHFATFECKSKLYDYNSYITDYIFKPQQLEKFDQSMGTERI